MNVRTPGGAALEGLPRFFSGFRASGPAVKAALPPAVFVALLALATLPWTGRMAHPAYARQTLLAALAAPAALAAGLLAVGPTLAGLRAALAAWPARVFLAAVAARAALAWASLAWTSDAQATLARAAELSVLAVWAAGWLLAAGALAARGSGAWEGLAAGHVAVVAALLFVGVFAWLRQWSRDMAPARLEQYIGNANLAGVLSIFPAAAGTAVLAAAARRRRSWPWPCGAAALAVLIALLCALLARSRSGFAGLAAAGLVLAAARLGRRGRLALAAAAVAVVLAGALYVVARPARLERAVERVKLSSIGARYYGARVSWGMFRERPLGGQGAGTFLVQASGRLPPERYLESYSGAILNFAHNEYAQAAAELGLAGLAALLALLAAALAGAWRGARAPPGAVTEERRALSAALAAAVAGVAVSALADPSLHFPDFPACFLAAAALAAAAGNFPAGTAATAPAAGPGRRVGVLAGGLALAAAAAALWALPDARRELLLRRGLAVERAAHRADDEPAAAKLYARAAGIYADSARLPGWYSYRLMALHGRARTLHLAGRANEAVAAAEELTRRMPGCPQYLRMLYDARLAAGDRAGALAALVESGLRDPYDGGLTAYFLRAFRAEPEAGRAALAGEVISRLGLTGARAALLRALAEQSAGRFAAALAAARGVPPGEPNFLPLDYWRGLCLFEAGRAGEAAEAFGRHVLSVPMHSGGYEALAQAQVAAGRSPADQAVVAALRRCVELDGTNDNARLLLVSSLIMRGEAAGALAVLLPRMPFTDRPADFALYAAQAYARLSPPKLGAARLTLERALRRTGDARLRTALRKLEELRRAPPPVPALPPPGAAPPAAPRSAPD